MRGAGDLVLKNAAERAGVKPLKVVEIGVRAGENAVFFLQGLPLEKLYLVDPYSPYKDSGSQQTQEMQDKYKEIMLKNIAPYKDKIELLQMTSEEASGKFEEESLDFVYIDGDHSKIAQDLELWWPKIKIGGLLGGHDYPKERYHNHFIVAPVDAFFKRIGYAVLSLAETDWGVVKLE